MSEAERDVDALRVLAAMPFLDRLELAAVAGVSEGTAHNALSRLQSDGLVDCIRHAALLTASTRRWRVTADGLHRLADQTGTRLRRLLRTYPVSAHWQRLLLARLDAVAVIYRLASTLGVPHRFRWYRSAALDAAMSLADGKTIGIIRQGATTDRTAFAGRVRWLPNTQQALPRALLALMPDEARLRQARKLLARYPGPVFLALERDVANSEADDRIWRITSNDAVLSLDEAIAHMRPGGGLPTEPPLTRLALPFDLAAPGEPERIPDHLLPAVLKPTEKDVLDRLADWPWIVGEDLSGMIDLSPSRTSTLLTSRLWPRLGLVSRISHLSGRRRLALSRRGLALLARRDRASVSRASSAMERRTRSKDNGLLGRLAERAGGAQPSLGPRHRAHRGGAPLHGGHWPGRPSEAHPGLPGPHRFQPAPPRHPLLPAPRQVALHSPRRVRRGAGWKSGPTPSSWSGSGRAVNPVHHGRLVSRPTCATTRPSQPLDDHGRCAPRSRRLRRPPSRGQLPRRGPQGDGSH